jgi:hypothetical protein
MRLSRGVAFVVLLAGLLLIAGLLLLAHTNREKHLRLRTAAEALSKSADECLLDVRDRKLTYAKAPNCSALSALAKQYIEAGGFRDNTPPEIDIVAERARATAWAALATSARARPGSIW